MTSSCNAQNRGGQTAHTDRRAAVAGSFYPATKAEIDAMLDEFFAAAPKVLEKQPLALVSPHAGYVFSGKVAAAAFRQIDREREFKHIFVIGSSHTMYFNGASIYTQGDFITPLGRVVVDPLAKELVEKYKVFTDDPKPHEREHSLEVQLPFLQYWLKKEFSIVPIIVGGESQSTCLFIAEALEPYFTDDNLFVISSDFCHYPDYNNAIESDNTMAGAILSNSAKEFMRVKVSDESKGTPGLVTAMCGWTSMLSLLKITEKRSDVRYQRIYYQNSGDTRYGDKDRVVGYHAIGVVREGNGKESGKFELTDDEKVELLRIARRTIREHLVGGSPSSIDEKRLPPNLLIPAGAFVTLKERGQLRGCIGNFTSDKALYKVVVAMAIAAATEDYRFSPVKLPELDGLDIELSVLTPMRKIKSIDEIEMGKHGIYIKKGGRSGTFLPQVANETHWSKEEFLGHCARDKAFIGWDGWKDADIYIYEALVFGEGEYKERLKK